MPASGSFLVLGSDVTAPPSRIDVIGYDQAAFSTFSQPAWILVLPEAARLDSEMAMREADPILVDRSESWLAIVTLNREPVRNAISRAMAQRLVQALDESATDSQLRA